MEMQLRPQITGEVVIQLIEQMEVVDFAWIGANGEVYYASHQGYRPDGAIISVYTVNSYPSQHRIRPANASEDLLAIISATGGSLETLASQEEITHPAA